MFRSSLATVALAALCTLSHAAPVVPTYTTFGNLAGATYGGSGIPTDPSAITVANGITLGMIAHQRYSNPALGNNGAGIYSATPGANDGLDGGGHSVAATWNFGYYINVGTAQIRNYRVELFYDLDPAVGTLLADLGRIDFNAAGAGALSLLQGSENLSFGYLNTGVPGIVFAPGSAPFNPDASGEYSFLLRVSDQSGAVLAESAILVAVPGAVPEPGSMALVGLALLGLAGVRRRR